MENHSKFPKSKDPTCHLAVVRLVLLHGCMRVQNPDQLAGVILRHDQNWSRARTVSALETGYDQHVGLRQKVPVHITYFTLRVNEDGSVTTFRDLYGHDGRMAAALF